jgi:hypothetical protein
MTTKPDGGSAFPCSKRVDEKYMDEGGYGRTCAVTVLQGGMTLRDYFAAKELSKKDGAGICDDPIHYQSLAAHCYTMADAMLAERNKP